ncbi:hypothetical protein GCM10011351_00680 [Paraliobacillus quinghaiensis]|uniref:Uncharacterized protein n=2 Tax=Paraliobacillus quinghaiensis TaxID=470815 RepID=A0A917TDW6_9BACI|nr:hypothetical protein [Paraliobacillus quinghaiensis]GGM18739.1 hypothetical protein GCM10011351_00680 [Paraliobacillus quinghaiensis]
MTIWVLLLVIILIVVMLEVGLKSVLSKKSSMEVMLFGLLFILTGGIFLVEPNLTKNSIILSVELGFVIFGIVIGVMGFFKR